jgi:hypothetical protein
MGEWCWSYGEHQFSGYVSNIPESTGRESKSGCPRAVPGSNAGWELVGTYDVRKEVIARANIARSTVKGFQAGSAIAAGIKAFWSRRQESTEISSC